MSTSGHWSPVVGLGQVLYKYDCERHRKIDVIEQAKIYLTFPAPPQVRRPPPPRLLMRHFKTNPGKHTSRNVQSSGQISAELSMLHHICLFDISEQQYEVPGTISPHLAAEDS